MAQSATDGWAWAETAAGKLAVDPALGNIRHLALSWGGQVVEPLHTAPWVEDRAVQSDKSILPIERSLAGDFFCAPFGASDLIDGPAHGWSANSAWTERDAVAGGLAFRLDRAIMGADVIKTLRLSDDAPLLYQEHVLFGGSGGLTVAHHPMVRMKGRGRFSCSPKRVALTPETPLELNRNRLAPGQRSEDLSALETDAGERLDLADLPIGPAHEDFVTLVEAAGQTLGWSAVVRDAEDDIVFFLKDPGVLPVTMLWHSNGGRDYRPWNGRHRGVLGIEDGCAAGAAGHRAALEPNRVSAEGVATSLSLAEHTRHRVAHVIGAVPRPKGWTEIAHIDVAGARLTLTDRSGQTLDLPFAQDFFSEML